MESQTMSTIGFLLAILAVIVAWIYYVFQMKPDPTEHDTDQCDCRECKRPARAGSSSSESTSSSSQKKKQSRQIVQSEPQFQHPWLMSTLKGHSGPVSAMAMSSNDHFLASVAEDRTILVWLAKDIEGRDHKQFRVNIPFDSASQVGWSPDNKAFIIAKRDDTSLEVFKVARKTDGSGGYSINPSLKFGKVHKSVIVGVGIAVNGRFIMSLSEDGLMIIWNLKGNVLEEKSISTTGLTLSGKLSPCGRYVAGCGTFNNPFMEIFEVNVSAIGKYTPLELRFKLPDHKYGISSFDFSVDGNKVVTMGIDKVWRLFDTTGNRVTTVREGLNEQFSSSASPVIALSHDARVVLIGSDTSLWIYSGITGALLQEIYQAHQEPIKALTFSSSDQYFLSSGDRMIRAFRNIPGITEKIIDLEISLNDQSTGQALKKRLTEELKQLRLELDSTQH